MSLCNSPRRFVTVEHRPGSWALLAPICRDLDGAARRPLLTVAGPPMTRAEVEQLTEQLNRQIRLAQSGQVGYRGHR